MKNKMFLFSLVTLLSVGVFNDARAQDTCNPDTFGFVCADDSTLQFCDQGRVDSVACDAEGLVCGAPACVGDCGDPRLLGGCVSGNAGDPCTVLLEGDPLECNAGLSCALVGTSDNLAETCIPSAGICDVGVASVGCDGDFLLLCRGNGQNATVDAYAYDCSLFGETCNPAGYCEGTEGTACDPSEDSTHRCAAGFECIIGDETVCEPSPESSEDVLSPPANDGGIGGRDDGVDDLNPQTTGCSNAGASTSFVGFSILGMLAASRIRRRR